MGVELAVAKGTVSLETSLWVLLLPLLIVLHVELSCVGGKV